MQTHSIDELTAALRVAAQMDMDRGIEPLVVDLPEVD